MSPLPRLKASARPLRLEALESRRLLARWTVDALEDVVRDDASVSLREAIAWANASPGADVVDFALGAEPATLHLALGELQITDDLRIEGPGSARLTLDASAADPTPGEVLGDGSRLFQVQGDSDAAISVSISGLTLTGGDASLRGGAILASGNLTLADLVIHDNGVDGGDEVFLPLLAALGGGGVHSSGGALTITNCRFSDNVANRAFGGAVVYANAQFSLLPLENLTVVGSVFKDNHATIWEGGALYAANVAQTLIADAKFSGNESPRGGGVSLSGDQIDVVRSSFDGNSGGGMHLSGGRSFIEQVTARNNVGGGAVVKSAQLFVESSWFENNVASRGGGLEFIPAATVAGIHLSPMATIRHSQFVGNHAFDEAGGAIYAKGRTDRSLAIEVIESRIEANVAASAGGGLYARYANLRMERSAIVGNVASTPGGGVAVFDAAGLSSFTAVEFFANSTASQVGGGGLYLESPPVPVGTIPLITLLRGVSIVDSAFISNSSARNGGAIYVRLEGVGPLGPDALTVVNSTLADNRAEGSGSALWIEAGNATLQFATIAYNRSELQGAVASEAGDVRLDHAIVAANLATSNPDLAFGENATLDAAFSLIGVAPSNLFAPSGQGNLLGSSADPLDPRLGSAVDGEGPTSVVPLLSDSPAIDAGDKTLRPSDVVPTFDQRGSGYRRISGGAIDLGAYELQQASRGRRPTPRNTLNSLPPISSSHH
ncbi:MAG: right-handed parallel beta-helix repeat-containing protein [Planctomycetales bacterium]|nr:right-handed parallel beta-helix repeat-containing protein [Planctomycetales bacterium]